MRVMHASTMLAVAAILVFSPVSVLAKNTSISSKKSDDKVVICHVGNEVGPNGETYDPACVPSMADHISCPDAGKIDLISVSSKAALKHLENPSHFYNGVSDYKPADVGASGVGAEDDDDSDFIDEGCEPSRTKERLFPCEDRNNYYDCRPYQNSACVLGTGLCECDWDAVVLSPFDNEDLCPGSNEAEPKNGECLSGLFCKPLPCEDRIEKSQCRPDNCALTGSCLCQWDAVSIGFSGDECPGTNEGDPCTVQLPGEAPFCTD